MYKFSIALFTAVLVLFYYSTVQAEELVYTDTVQLTKTDWSNSVSIPQFDTTRGDLAQVEFQLIGSVEGSAEFESLDAVPSTITVSMGAIIHLQRPNGMLISESEPRAIESTAVTGFDGELDFAGTSGTKFDHLIDIHIAETSILSAETDLQFFSGIGTIELPIDALGVSSGSGAGNLALAFTTMASATVSVRYVYDLPLTPAIDLEKWTNGNDADLPTGPQITVGEPVTWTYIIQNTGNTTLTNLSLLDDKLGDILTSCPQTTLAIGEEIVCTVTGIATAGQYSNTAVVSATTPPDPLRPTVTVTDTDPSHYYGIDSGHCPVDVSGNIVLPTVEYLGPGYIAGQGFPEYQLPDGFDVFIVKKYSPFRFEVLPGPTYVSTRRREVNPERVWVCGGNCDFVSGFHDAISFGTFDAGVTLNVLILDDDRDDRVNGWIANGNIDQPYQVVDTQDLVEFLSFEVPFAAEWGYYAADSIGVVSQCVTPAASQSTNSSETSMPPSSPAPPDMSERLFLPNMLND